MKLSHVVYFISARLSHVYAACHENVKIFYSNEESMRAVIVQEQCICYITRGVSHGEGP